MDEREAATEYSIAAVSKLTGIGCHALRVWERRYGYPVPRRSSSGHRRYGPDQVQALRHVTRRLQEGESIGDLMAALQAGVLQVPDAPAATAHPSAELVDRLAAGDLEGAEEAYDRLAGDLTPMAQVERLLEPALIDTGERWFRGECHVYQERLASGFVRRKLSRLLDDARRANPRPHRRLLLGTVQGDRHEGGALMLGLALELSGCRALLLGVDLPVREYQRAVDHLRPTGLAVSFVLSRNITKRFQELSKLRGTPVFVGGRSIVNYQGLARRHGLVPVLGTAASAAATLLRTCEAAAAGSGPAAPPSA